MEHERLLNCNALNTILLKDVPVSKFCRKKSRNSFLHQSSMVFCGAKADTRIDMKLLKSYRSSRILSWKLSICGLLIWRKSSGVINIGEIELQQLTTDLAQVHSQLANTVEWDQRLLMRITERCARVGAFGIFGNRH